MRKPSHSIKYKHEESETAVTSVDALFNVSDPVSRAGMSNATFVKLVVAVHKQITADIDAVKLVELIPSERVELAVEAVKKLAATQSIHLTANQIRAVAKDVEAEISEYGPIQELLSDPGVTEIMVNGPGKIYVERQGKLYLHDKVFKDDAHLMRIIERIVHVLGRRIDESSPMVDARLPNGSRVNVIIPPLAVDGPILTVRKFSREPLTADLLVENGTMSDGMRHFLRAAVEAKITIMISGGTGSGKTTTLNALSGFIPSNERIVTIEDAAELRLPGEHALVRQRQAVQEGVPLIQATVDALVPLVEQLGLVWPAAQG